MQTITFEFNGYEATVIRPENPNGRWIWKTEFLFAFDNAERELLELGYTRVYYKISNMYGSKKAVGLMREFMSFVTEKFGLYDKCILFGFSRGGLYAFNFAREYPECVEKIYLDAPVLDLRTWPPMGGDQSAEMCREHGISESELETYKENPIENMDKLFAHGIPLLLVAGDSDEIVPFDKNSGKMIEYCRDNNVDITYAVKPGCKHHPHSLDDAGPIIDFVCSQNV